MTIWKIDQAHTDIKFKVKHLVVSTVTGHFGSFDGLIETENDDFSDAKVTFEADVDSINTKNEQRDNHLKSPDFFDAANHPKIKFVSKSIAKKSDSDYELTGDLSIRGIKKEVKLTVTFNGFSKGFGGISVAGFELAGKVNRFDYGLQWNALTEAGGVVVSEDVKLDISVELQKVEPVQKAA